MASFQQLPDEVVLNHILCRLVDVTTRVRFAAVCRSWRALSREAPPPMPCVFMMTRDADAAAAAAKTTWSPNHPVPFLFDPVSSTIHRLPGPRERIWVEGIAGFLGTYLSYTPPFSTSNSLSLLYNPFSGQTLTHELPRMTRDPDGRRHLMLSPIYPLQKAQLSSPDPSTPGRRPCLLVAAVDHLDSRVRICRMPDLLHSRDIHVDDDIDQAEWVVSAPIDHDSAFIRDLIFYKGELYCISSDGGRIFAFDLHRHLHHPNGVISSPTPRNVHPPSHGGGNLEIKEYWPYTVSYELVESSGDLLVVTRYDLIALCAVEFEVHRLDLEEGALVRVHDLGDTMLFLGRGCSMSWRGPTPNQFFRKNCIYFFKFDKPFYRLGRFSVGSRSSELLPDSLPAVCCPLWIKSPS